MKAVKKMAKDWLTDEQVEQEIESLRTSPMVQLARKEEHLKYKEVMLFGNGDDFDE